MRKYLYFRNTATAALDDGTDASGTGAAFRTSVMFPADNLRGIVPSSDTTIKLMFDSVAKGGKHGMGAQNTVTEVVAADHVLLTCTKGDLEDVIKAIVQAITGAKSPHSDGVITVCDDVTGVTIHNSLANMAADSIVIAAAN